MCPPPWSPVHPECHPEPGEPEPPCSDQDRCGVRQVLDLSWVWVLRGDLGQGASRKMSFPSLAASGSLAAYSAPGTSQETSWGDGRTGWVSRAWQGRRAVSAAADSATYTNG